MKMALVVATVAIILSGCNQKSAPADAESAEESVASADPLVQEKEPQSEEPAGTTSTLSGTGLCAPGEDVLFSCQLENKKMASVCGLKNGTGSVVAQYRYGKVGQVPELAWPGPDSADRIQFASVPYSGGGEAQLQFRRGDTQYIIYSRVIRTNFAPGEPNDPAIEDGIFVRKAGKTVARHSCSDPDVRPIDYDKSELYAATSEDGVVELEY